VKVMAEFVWGTFMTSVSFCSIDRPVLTDGAIVRIVRIGGAVIGSLMEHTAFGSENFG